MIKTKKIVKMILILEMSLDVWFGSNYLSFMKMAFSLERSTELLYLKFINTP